MRILPRSSQTSPKILVVRCDRIGDVILSTPVLSALKKAYPTSQITFMVQEVVASLVRESVEIDNVFVYDPNGRHSGISGFFKLMEELRAQRFEIAIVLQSQFKVSAALYGIGIPNRLGPLSKIHSFFFFNRGTRQRRSLVEMHEADYNLQLLRKLGIRAQTQSLPTRISIKKDCVIWAREFLNQQGWSEENEDHSPLIVVHPGMGGSALNWPENYYLELIKSLFNAGNTVLITGGKLEAPLLERLSSELKNFLSSINETEHKRIIFYNSTYRDDEHDKFYGVDYLAALFSFGSVVVAPSTGPLHIAVALGKPVVTFYPPIRVQSALRWGPYHLNESDASILVPEVYCGEDFKCRGSQCNYFPCMKTLIPNQALEEVNSHLSRALMRKKRETANIL